MTFLLQDEHILLMNLSGHMLFDSPLLQLNDRKQLHDVGLLTAIEYPEWGQIEPAKGQYDFSVIEWMLSVNRKAGLRTLFSIPGPFFPTWIPNEWKFKYSNGTYNTSSISFWSVEGQEYLKNFMQMLISKYASDDVSFFFGELDTGESIYPGGALYDDNAKRDFQSKYGNGEISFSNNETKSWLTDVIISHYIDIQGIFYPINHDVWDAHQWLISRKFPESMNYVQPALLEALKTHFCDATLYLLQYTYFDSSHPQENVAYVESLQHNYKCEVIAEAMFCDGLPNTTPQSIAKGFRGQILCPTHQHTGKKHIEDWMLTNIKNSLALWKDSKK